MRGFVFVTDPLDLLFTPPYPFFRDQAWDLEGFCGISSPLAPNSIFTRYFFLHINVLRYIIIIV